MLGGPGEHAGKNEEHEQKCGHKQPWQHVSTTGRAFDVSGTKRQGEGTKRKRGLNLLATISMKGIQRSLHFIFQSKYETIETLRRKHYASEYFRTMTPTVKGKGN